MESTATPFRLPRGWPRWRSLVSLTGASLAVAALVWGPGIARVPGGCGFYVLTGACCPG